MLAARRKNVDDFHENLNSSSCLSNNRIWILNLQYMYIHIYSSDITVKGKAVYSLFFIIRNLSRQSKGIHPPQGPENNIFVLLSDTGIDSRGALELPLPEQPPDFAQIVHARTWALAHVTLPGTLKNILLMFPGS